MFLWRESYESGEVYIPLANKPYSVDYGIVIHFLAIRRIKEFYYFHFFPFADIIKLNLADNRLHSLQQSNGA